VSARRPLLTATAAGSLLCALWFVPSAHATAGSGGHASDGQTQTRTQTQTRAEPQAIPGGDLADTGSVDVTPYLVGGTAFLGLGIAMVTASVRRTRPEAY
jgi:hypothetical protein